MEALIAKRLGLQIKDITSVLKLLSEGATIPFIARYRKESTGSLDEVQIQKIEKEYKSLVTLAARKKTILDRLDELNNNDAALRADIRDCYDSTKLEDLYLPFKPKRKTRASAARDLGLEPLAKIIMAQHKNDISYQASRYVSKGMTKEQALQGGRDIIAEWISEHSYARNQIRKIYHQKAILSTKVNKKKEAEASKYRDFFDYRQLLNRIPGHRLLAILRAESNGLLKVKIEIPNDEAIKSLERIFIKSQNESAQHVKLAVADALKRLLQPSLESETRKIAKEKADTEAIEIFAKNLSQLLLSAPLGPKSVMGLDPGFRTGCKLVCLNDQSNLVYSSTIYPHPPHQQKSQAANEIISLCRKYDIKAIAIGNGTAGRETEQFVRDILTKDNKIEVYTVNEAGASIYSASETGREEFPDLDLTIRGAISIARRLIDPLAELVKLDPKNIGVGQYQHDVDQERLQNSLDHTVSFAVNKVGVNLNTASVHLLKYVSGVGPKLAENIVDHRNRLGPYKSRQELLQVKGLGLKSFEQGAGFLRINHGINPLDASAVHPESYHIVGKMAESLGSNLTSLINNEALTKKLELMSFVDADIGLPTLKDIVMELNKPGLDPRGSASSIQYDEKIKVIKDLNVGMVLNGKVTNITKFGAFVDIGIKENGLLHISQITDRYISDPSEVLRLNQEVTVSVVHVDLERKRIQLTMKH